MMKLEKKKVALTKETLAYIDEGQGEVLLFIHGNMSSSAHFLPLIEKLKGEYRCVAPDLRGFGDSTYNNRFSSLKELAFDVKEFCDKLGLSKVNLIGWSTGGGVILELAANFPEMVNGLFSIEGASHKGYPVFKKDAMYQAIYGQIYATKEEMAADPVQVGPAIRLLENHDFAGMTSIWNAVIYTVNKPSEEENEFYMNETLKQRNVLDIDWSLANFNMGDTNNFYADGDGTIHNVKCKCAFTSGEKDLTVPPRMVMENYTVLKDNAKLITYVNCGHDPLIDNLDGLLKDIRDFFKN